jgi:hypothetical protein
MNGNSYITSGNVGIGTTSPTVKLHIVSNEYVLQAETASDMYFYTTPGVSRHFNFYNVRQDADYNFKQNVGGVLGTSTLVIKGSSGNVLIGTTTDAGYKLDVVGADSRFNGVRVGLGGGSISSNTTVGVEALNSNTTGTGVTAIGYRALRLSTGSNNTAVGFEALIRNTTGSLNSTLGLGAGRGITTGVHNVSIGSYSVWTGNSSFSNAVGTYALFNSSGSNNNAFGHNALGQSTSGGNNTAMGHYALYANTASNNVAVGYEAAYTNASGSVTAVGYRALRNNTTGVYNTAVGSEAALTNTTGAGITAIGWRALLNNTASDNTAVGTEAALANTTGSGITAIGYQSLKFSTGANNTGLGYRALFNNTTGSNNTASGYQALFNNTASNNVALGFQAGNANTTGANNIFIGYQATGVSATESNRTWIGNSSTTSTWLAGNVLIGTTTNAGYKLDVNGNIRAAVSAGTSLTSLTPGTNVTSVYAQAQSQKSAIVSSTSDGYTFEGQTIYQGANIGSWGANGTVNLGAFMYGNVNYHTSNNGFYHTWYGSRASNPWMTLNNTGLGIGTTTPAYKLQVQGTVSAQLTNATHADQVYYNSATGELTYGAAAGGSTPTLDQVTTAGNTTTNAITVDKLTINNGTYNASIGFGLINNPTANYFDVFFANNTGLRFGSPSFDGSAFQAFGGLHASYPGQLYFDYGSQQRTVANRSANFRNASSPSPVTVMKLTDTSNVLIGTTIDNGERLQVSGQVSADAYIAAGQQGLTIDIPTGAGQTLHFEGGILTSVF